MSSIAEESSGALKRAAAFAAAGILALAAVIFIAAAIVVAAAGVMPFYAAFLAGALFLIVLAFGAGLFAKTRMQVRQAADESAARGEQNGGLTSLLERHSLGALTTAVAARPGKTLLAGLAAGATLGVLEALDRRSRR